MCHRMEVCCILYKGEDKGKSSAEQHLSSREVHLQFYNTEGSIKLLTLKSISSYNTCFIALFIALYGAFLLFAYHLQFSGVLSLLFYCFIASVSIYKLY